ncbi:MAG: efflux RND transporter periplasmic adaptor subunit [Novosphingobium sp.]
MNDDGGQSHSPIDAFLGAAPKRARRHLTGIAMLAIAVVVALFLAVRFLAGTGSPYYFAPVEAGNLTPKVSERGIIRGSRDLVIRSGVEGTISRLEATSGTVVKSGQELARIDAGSLQQLLDADIARLDAARTELDAARTAADQKADVLARYQRVWAKSAGRVPSRNEMTSARAEAGRSSQEQDAAEARLREAQLEVEARRKEMDATVIRAPFSGFVSMRELQVGQRVRQGTELFRLTPKGDTLTITVPWVAAEPARRQAGARATVRIDKLPEQTWSARLIRISAADGGEQATFVLDDPTDALCPGMDATLEMALPERRNVLLVPDAALQFAPETSPDRTRAQVYLLGEDGNPQRVYVTVGGSDGTRTEIFTNAIKSGAQVIIGMRGVPHD